MICSRCRSLRSSKICYRAGSAHSGYFGVAHRLGECLVLRAAPVTDMSEIEFIRAVLTEADCDLHLDVNNVYVNSVNHGYDPVEFIRAMPIRTDCLYAYSGSS